MVPCFLLARHCDGRTLRHLVGMGAVFGDEQAFLPGLKVRDGRRNELGAAAGGDKAQGEEGAIP